MASIIVTQIDRQNMDVEVEKDYKGGITSMCLGGSITFSFVSRGDMTPFITENIASGVRRIDPTPELLDMINRAIVDVLNDYKANR